MVKNPPTNAGDVSDAGLNPGSGGSLGGGYSNLLQYSCLEDPMDREAWQAAVYGVGRTESDTTEATQQHLDTPHSGHPVVRWWPPGFSPAFWLS